MKNIFLFFFLFGLYQAALSGQELKLFEPSKKIVVSWNDTSVMNFVKDPSMYSEGWDTLPQVIFWKNVINMTSDSCIINVAYCRKPVNKINSLTWINQTEEDKICFKDSICRVNGLDSATNLFITSGKGEFYEVKKVLPDISKAIGVFRKYNCDPWYAQAILLIESPGKSKSKSYVGANGPFQLMRSVARLYGLHVNKKMDERTDLSKSARAASALLNKSCIPNVKKILDDNHISYNESDLWFRLLVLHAYHAGSGNIRCVIEAIHPSAGGIDLFQKVWQTTCRGFKNESQNYSQIALASLINFDHLVSNDGDTVFLVKGDKLLRTYNKKNSKHWESYEYLNKCMSAYENDFLEGVIPFDYFMKRISFIRKEYTRLARLITKADKNIVLKNYPSSEEHLALLAGNMTKRQRYEDAIRLLKLNLDNYPSSVSSCDSIARLYRLTGDKKKADFYSNRADKISGSVKNTD